MQRVEQRLQIGEEKQDMGDVKVQTKLFQLIQKLELPELSVEERLDIAAQLRESFGVVQEFQPVEIFA